MLNVSVDVPCDTVYLNWSPSSHLLWKRHLCELHHTQKMHLFHRNLSYWLNLNVTRILRISISHFITKIMNIWVWFRSKGVPRIQLLELRARISLCNTMWCLTPVTRVRNSSWDVSVSQIAIQGCDLKHEYAAL